jgi:hypothetical protein
MSTRTPIANRHRGGQPGNTNALKHGFYTRRFSHSDLAGVESIDKNGLLDEIAIIRLYARRLIELDERSSDISQVANILRILCLASLTITRLVKTSQFLQLHANTEDSDLHKALQMLTIQLNLDHTDPTSDGVFKLPGQPTP